MMKNLFSNLFQYTAIIPLNKILPSTCLVFRFFSIKTLSAAKYVLITLFSFICVFASAVPDYGEFLNATGKYYENLGVSENATQKEIKTSFVRLSIKHHPDRGGNEEKMKEINEAYRILKNPEKRAKYDERMRQRRSTSSSTREGSFQDESQHFSESVDDLYRGVKDLKSYMDELREKRAKYAERMKQRRSTSSGTREGYFQDESQRFSESVDDLYRGVKDFENYMDELREKEKKSEDRWFVAILSLSIPGIFLFPFMVMGIEKLINSREISIAPYELHQPDIQRESYELQQPTVIDIQRESYELPRSSDKNFNKQKFNKKTIDFTSFKDGNINFKNCEGEFDNVQGG